MRLAVVADRVAAPHPAADTAGIVPYREGDPAVRGRTIPLEHGLEEGFGLREAIVIGSRSESPTVTRRALGQAAAEYLDRRLRGGERVGISWGTTLGP